MRLSSIRFGGQYERYRFPADRHAVAKFAHQRFGGVRECLKARQSKKAACSFDGVNESENVAENLAVIGLSLKAHQLCVDAIEAFGRLVKNSRNNSSMNASCRLPRRSGGLQNPLRPRTPLKGRGSLLPKRLLSVAE